MKKIKFLFISILTFSFIGAVRAENISVSDIVAKFQQKSGYTVTNKADGSEFSVNNGVGVVDYKYSQSDNLLTYSVGTGKTVGEVVGSDDVLGFIVELSPNYQQYVDAKAASNKENVSYGTGCDLVNMGFCYDSASGNMQVSLSDQFTTYLYNYYSDTGSANTDPIDADASKNSSDPLPIEDVQTTGDSKNPDTGTFTEIGIIIALFALLIIVISLKKRSETEFKI